MTTALRVDMHVSVDENLNYLSGSVLKLSCEKGYSLNKPDLSTVECLEVGEWNSSFPICLERLFYF